MGGSAPRSDPQMGQAALLSAQTGRDMLAWMKNQAEVTNGWAAEDRARYKGVFEPLQDQFIAEAQGFASPERKAAAADAAAADVTLAAGQQQGQMRRQMGAMGINPASGRFIEAMRRGGTDTALATAGARNLATRTVDDQGRQLRAAAINMGSGMGVNPGTSMGLSNSAGSAGFQGAMSGYNQQASILHDDWKQRMAGWEAKNSMMSGLFGGLGTIAGALPWGTGILSSKSLKTDKAPVDGALEAVKAMPVEKWTYKPGVADGGTHVGPYAEDFAKATGMGDGKTIDPISAWGVTMKAVQEVDAKVESIASHLAARKGQKRPAMGLPERRAA